MLIKQAIITDLGNLNLIDTNKNESNLICHPPWRGNTDSDSRGDVI